MKYLHYSIAVCCLILLFCSSGCRTKPSRPKAPPLSIVSPSITIGSTTIEPGITRREVLRRLRANNSILLPEYYRKRDTLEYKDDTWEIPVIFLTRYALLQIFFENNKVLGTHLTDLK